MTGQSGGTNVWAAVTADGFTIDIIPLCDLIAHEWGSECVCGPYCEMVREELGDSYLVHHVALDGRVETDRPPACWK